MTKFGDKTVLHVHVQVTSSFSQPLYYYRRRKQTLDIALARKSSGTRIAPFFDNDPYILYICFCYCILYFNISIEGHMVE